MTDKETLYLYRMKQAQETLADAQNMLKGGCTPRSITNRAYYSMFYALLALFLKAGVNIKTSKHIGVISIFDSEFVKAGKVDRQYSKSLHALFDARLEGDYKENVEVASEDASEHVKLADEFIKAIKEIADKISA